jgi:hypothetical protein
MCPSFDWLDRISRSDIQEELAYISSDGKLSEHGEAMFSGLIESTPNKSLNTDGQKRRFALLLPAG